MLIVSHISSHYNNSVADEVGPLFFLEGGETMSDFEILSIVIDILTILISFGSLIALIWGYRTKRVGTLIPIIER